MKCVIFRCSKKPEMYLYVPYREAETALLKDLPAALTSLTGQLERVMELELSPARKLARARVEDVMVALQEKGFYLQSPPNALLQKDQGMLYDPGDSF